MDLNLNRRRTATPLIRTFFFLLDFSTVIFKLSWTLDIICCLFLCSLGWYRIPFLCMCGKIIKVLHISALSFDFPVVFLGFFFLSKTDINQVKWIL